MPYLPSYSELAETFLLDPRNRIAPGANHFLNYEGSSRSRWVVINPFPFETNNPHSQIDIEGGRRAWENTPMPDSRLTRQEESFSDPDRAPKSSSLCMYLMQTGYCDNRDCNDDHKKTRKYLLGLLAKIMATENYKVAFCKSTWMSGEKTPCPYGLGCTFAHSKRERQNPGLTRALAMSLYEKLLTQGN